MNAENITLFHNFGVEHVPKEIKKITGNKDMIANIYRIQAYGSIMCGYFCTGFVDFMLKRKILLNYTNLLTQNDYEKNDKKILKYFQ